LKIRLLLPARRELRDAISYYSLQRQNLGAEFREEAWAAIQRIKAFPLAWHPLGDNIRRCQMVRFPYGIIYQPSSTDILIIAVACLHQKPDYWRNRI